MAITKTIYPESCLLYTSVSKEKLDEIAAQYATPFYLYDEAAIRETARRVNKAFAWNQGFKEYFAVKATPNPAILKILHEEGCGADCSSYTELQMADAVGFKGDEIMFSSNATPAEDFQLARQLNVTINLDDITPVSYTHLDVYKRQLFCSGKCWSRACWQR